MRLFALDLGNRCGFASGVAGGAKPRIESWSLRPKGADINVACRNLGCSLRDNIQLESPDLIVIENYMHPAAQPSADVIIVHMQLHGVVEGIAGCFGVRTERPTSAQFRKHFCGVSTMAARRGGLPRTARQREEDRRAINDLVLKRAILLGYLPKCSVDWDKASAAALYDYGCAYFARTPPRELHMFGERLAGASP